MKYVMCLLACVASIGCTDAQTAKWSAIGEPHKIELYSGGKKVREWKSTGVVQNESQSDGFYFNDAETGVLVRLTGDLVITPIE